MQATACPWRARSSLSTGNRREQAFLLAQPFLELAEPCVRLFTLYDEPVSVISDDIDRDAFGGPAWREQGDEWAEREVGRAVRMLQRWPSSVCKRDSDRGLFHPRSSMSEFSEFTALRTRDAMVSFKVASSSSQASVAPSSSDPVAVCVSRCSCTEASTVKGERCGMGVLGGIKR